MSRKTVLALLVVISVLLSGMSNSALAVTVANTSQKGSLLIFPKIQTAKDPGSGTVAVDTIVYLSNDSSDDVNLKCYWVDENQTSTDFTLTVEPYQPVAFSAHDSSGGLMGKGQLLCWAVDAEFDAQIQFNHLSGSALIQYTAPSGFAPSPVPSAVFYNAWAYKALKDPGPAHGGIVGLLPLDGKTYDASPRYLYGHYTPGETLSKTLTLQAELTLTPCRQDLRQDRTPTCTNAKFDIWNENRTKFTGARQCLANWYEGFLEKLGNDPSQKGPGYGGNKFTAAMLQTFAAHFRVEGVKNTICNSTKGCPQGSQVNSPLVGVLLYQSQFPEATPDRVPYAGHTLQGAGVDARGFIKWDPPGNSPESY